MIFKKFCLFIFSPCYVVLCASKARHGFGSKKVSWCLGNFSLFKTAFPGQNSVPPSFVSFFVFYIFSYLLLKSWIAFLGAWCPLPAFRSCFVECTRCLNALLMNLWGRKFSPRPAPPPSWLLQPNIFVVNIFHDIWKTVYSKVRNCFFQLGFHCAFAWLREEMTTNKIEVNDLWNPLYQKLGYCPTAPRNHEW